MKITYDNFVGYELNEAITRFTQGPNQRPPGNSEIAHFTWQRLIDRREYQNWLEQCALHGYKDVPWVTENEGPIPPPVDPGSPTWRPTSSAIRHVTGDFLDALHGFARPTFMLPGMPVDEQNDVIAYYPGSHLPFGWKAYYNKFPQWGFDYSGAFDLYEASVDRCFGHQRIPVCAIPIEQDDTLRGHLGRIRPFLERLLGANRLVCVQWGWEINDITDWTADGDTQLEYLKGLRDIIGPDIPVYAHWTPERWSGWPSFRNTTGDPEDEGGELDWLRAARAEGLNGVFYQDWPDKLVAAVLERALYLDKKNYQGPGICGRVQTADLDFVMFEHSRDPDHFNAIVQAVVADGRATVYC